MVDSRPLTRHFSVSSVWRMTQNGGFNGVLTYVKGLSAIAFAVILLPLASTFVADPAEAANYLNCKWSSASVSYYNSASSSYITSIDSAASSWNTVVNPAKMGRTYTYSSRQLSIFDTNAGNVGWSGITRMPGTATSMPTCTSGRWVEGEMEIALNSYYLSTYSPAARKGVVIHEMGHAFGLAHNTLTIPCYTGIQVVAIMYPSDSRFSTACPVFTPMADDVLGVNTLY